MVIIKSLIRRSLLRLVHSIDHLRLGKLAKSRENKKERILCTYEIFLFYHNKHIFGLEVVSIDGTAFPS